MSNFGPSKAAWAAFESKAESDLCDIGQLSIDTILDGLAHSLPLEILAQIGGATES